jgi:hypothetical protein
MDMIVIEATNGQVVIHGHGELSMTPEEAFSLAGDLIEKAKQAKEQRREKKPAS